MKINSISLISAVALIAGATNANAGAIADFYVGGMVGAGGQTLFADNETKTKSAMLFGAVAGVDIPLVRIEAEYSYLNSSDLNTNAGMVNVFFKLPSTIVKPYIGAGAGMIFGGEHEYAPNTKQDLDSVVAYQAMLGATIDLPVMPFKFDIEGHALYAPDIYKIAGSNTTPDLLQYDVRLKIRFVF